MLLPNQITFIQFAVEIGVVVLHSVNEQLMAHANRLDALQHGIAIGRRRRQHHAPAIRFQVAGERFLGQTRAETNFGNALQVGEGFGFAFFQLIDDIGRCVFEQWRIGILALIANVAVKGLLDAVLEILGEPSPAGDVRGGEVDFHILAVGLNDFSDDV